jgi:hypothetical protein
MMPGRSRTQRSSWHTSEDNWEMRARVTWLKPEYGGRESGAPTSGEYRPNALFLAPSPNTAEALEPEFGSVRFFFATDDPSDVGLDFWSPQDLSRYIYDGSPFIVMEARTPVAFARMYADPQNPS